MRFQRCKFRRRLWTAVSVCAALAATFGVASGAEDQSALPPGALRIWSVAFSPDGKYLASGSGIWDTPGRLVLWDVVAKRPKWVRDEKLGIAHLTYSPDGKWIALGGYDQIGRLIDAATGEERVKFVGHTAGVNSVSFSPDGKRLATAGLDKLVKIWDVESGAERMSLAGHDDMAITVAFAPDGRRVASAGRDRKAVLWDLETQQIVRTFNGHEHWIQQVVFSPDGAILATASYDGAARTWDVETGRHLSTLSGARGALASAAFTPDSMELATVGDDRTVRFYELISPGREVNDPAAFAEAVNRLDDDSYAVREAAMHELASLGFSASDELAAGASASKPREMRIRCQRLLDRLRSPPITRQLTAHAAPLQFLAFSPGGEMLATAARDGTIMLWDSRNWTSIATLVMPPKK